jgi:hypothetical protein
VSGPDASEREAVRAERRAASDATTVPGDPEEWMRWDDEFLFDADREYVLREESRSWRGWVAPSLFGLGLAVLIGDAITVGLGTAMGLETTHPVATPVVAELGLGGLVLLKAAAAIFLVLLPGVTDSARQTARAGLAGVAAVGLVVAVSTTWAVLGVAG